MTVLKDRAALWPVIHHDHLHVGRLVNNRDRCLDRVVIRSYIQSTVHDLEIPSVSVVQLASLHFEPVWVRIEHTLIIQLRGIEIDRYLMSNLSVLGDTKQLDIKSEGSDILNRDSDDCIALSGILWLEPNNELLSSWTRDLNKTLELWVWFRLILLVDRSKNVNSWWLMGIIMNRVILEALPVAKVEAKSVLFAGHFVMKRKL